MIECINCAERHPACQDSCKRFLEDKAQRNEKAERIRKAKASDKLASDVAISLYNERRRKANRYGGCMNIRNKGAAGERELAAVLREYGFNTRRGQQYCGANGDADVVGLPGVHIECKRVEKLNIDNAIEQAISDSKNNEMPAVFHRKNRKKWLVTISLEDFMKLYKEKGNESIQRV